MGFVIGLLLGLILGILAVVFWPKILAKITAVNQKLDKPPTPAP